MGVSDLRNGRVVRWPLGADAGQPVAGKGAPVNGINEFAGRISITSDGKLVVADRRHHRILQFGDAGGEIIGQGKWQIDKLFEIVCSGDAIYVADDNGMRVQKLAQGSSSIV